MLQYFILFLLTFFSLLDASERYIAVLASQDFVGEFAFAYRIKSACNNLHWKVDLISIQNAKELKKKNYDFVINLTPGTYKHPKCNNYLAIFHPTHHYFRKGYLTKDY